MGPIVAIGGGDMVAGQTDSIDREIVRLTGVKMPKALFVPTASADDLGYCDSFASVYRDRLGCRAESLLLIKQRYSPAELREKILGADLVYVGGGSTLNLMRIWRRTGVDRLFKEAHSKGVVLSGMSAGANCWFQYSHSDSRKFFANPKDGYMRVTCMGLARGTYCPHLLGEGRLDDFAGMIGKYGGVGYGVDNCAALLVLNGEIKALRSQPGVVVKKLWREKGVVNQMDLP